MILIVIRNQRLIKVLKKVHCGVFLTLLSHLFKRKKFLKSRNPKWNPKKNLRNHLTKDLSILMCGCKHLVQGIVNLRRRKQSLQLNRQMVLPRLRSRQRRRKLRRPPPSLIFLPRSGGSRDQSSED